MVAEHSIMVQSGRGIQYKFNIHRKYTVIRGDSATGKTTLVRMIEDATVRKTADISCDVPCVVLPDMNWEINMDAFAESIVFIDEDHPALTTGKKLAEKMFSSDNCFVIISRDKRPWISYSYKEIYEIKSSGKFHRLERIYGDMEDFQENEKYVTEDEAADLSFTRSGLEKQNCFCRNVLSGYYCILLYLRQTKKCRNIWLIHQNMLVRNIKAGKNILQNFCSTFHMVKYISIQKRN